MTKVQSKVKSSKNSKDFYSFKNYKPNKNAVPITYKGTEYLSKAQCMALEGITRKELDAYLKGEVNDPVPISKPEDVISERVDLNLDDDVF